MPVPPEFCANCGAAIPPGARACPECGADERTGWREDSVYDGLDLPDEAGDAAAPGPPRLRGRHALPWYWLAAALLVVIVLALQALRLWSSGRFG